MWGQFIVTALSSSTTGHVVTYRNHWVTEVAGHSPAMRQSKLAPRMSVRYHVDSENYRRQSTADPESCPKLIDSPCALDVRPGKWWVSMPSLPQEELSPPRATILRWQNSQGEIQRMICSGKRSILTLNLIHSSSGQRIPYGSELYRDTWIIPAMWIRELIRSRTGNIPSISVSVRSNKVELAKANERHPPWRALWKATIAWSQNFWQSSNNPRLLPTFPKQPFLLGQKMLRRTKQYRPRTKSPKQLRLLLMINWFYMF